jgi:hypothetical protein
MILWLALAYLEVGCARSESLENLADVMRLHRQERAQQLLEAACRLARQVSDLSRVLDRFTVPA